MSCLHEHDAASIAASGSGEDEWQTLKPKKVTRKNRKRQPAATATQSQQPQKAASSSSSSSSHQAAVPPPQVGVHDPSSLNPQLTTPLIIASLQQLKAYLLEAHPQTVKQVADAVLEGYWNHQRLKRSEDDRRSDNNLYIISYGIGNFAASCLYSKKATPSTAAAAAAAAAKISKKTKTKATDVDQTPSYLSVSSPSVSIGKPSNYIGKGWDSPAYQLGLMLAVKDQVEDRLMSQEPLEEDEDDSLLLDEMQALAITDQLHKSPKVICATFDPVTTSHEIHVMGCLGVKYLATNDRACWDVGVDAWTRGCISVESREASQPEDAIENDALWIKREEPLVEVPIESSTTQTERGSSPFHLFLMPHNPLTLYSNLLSSNISTLCYNPSALMVVGNSFKAYCEKEGLGPNNQVEMGIGVFAVGRRAERDQQEEKNRVGEAEGQRRQHFMDERKLQVLRKEESDGGDGDGFAVALSDTSVVTFGSDGDGKQCDDEVREAFNHYEKIIEERRRRGATLHQEGGGEVL